MGVFNLGVDCISRDEAIQTIQRYGVGCFDADEFSPEECERFVISKLNELPSVTPQEPRKGHWILVQRGKCIDICCSKCEAVRIKEFAYNYTIDKLDREDVKECLESDDMRYCPYCGSDNREVEG